MRFTAISLSLIMLSDFLLGAALRAEPIPVRYEQGSSHGFLALKTLDGATIATGEATQVVSRGKVTSRLIFRFKDGSVDDDVTVFTQNKVFRLLTDHHIQHGPSFPKPIDFLIDMTSGDLTSKAEDGSLSKEHMDLPSDVSNGLPPNLLLNILPLTPETRVSYIAPGKKARLIHIAIRPTGNIPFRVGAFRRKATDFTLHVELGGVTGVIAPLIGKQPTDYHIWLQAGNPPAFVREEGALYEAKNLVLEYDPQPSQDMLVACIWDCWTRPGSPDLYSFAAITDEPTPEVAATGHQRTVISLQKQFLSEWLSPSQISRERLDEILSEKDTPYLVHQIAA